MSLASYSRVLFAVLALSLFAAAAATTASSRPSPHTATATASSQPSPHAATATASSQPSPHAATATASSQPSPHAATATATAFSCPSPHASTATSSPRPSPQGHPPAEETMEEEEDGGDEDNEERYLLHDLEQLMREGAAAKGTAARLEHIANVLQLLGYREMAAAVPSLAASPIITAWPGPLTVFAVPDEELPDRWTDVVVLVKHIALGSFPHADLSSRRQRKVAAAMVGFCFTATTSPSIGNITVFINGVKIVRPDVYNDDRLVVHGVESAVTLPPQGSCYSAHLLSKADIIRLLIRLLG